MALAKGARQRGARIVENVKVTGVTAAGGRVTGVAWDDGAAQGAIATDIVVNCAGMWGRDLAGASGVTLPLHACEHFYIVTEPIPGLGQLPVLRVPDECAYYKEDAGKILLGAFEPVAKPWGMDGIREDFAFDQLPEDFDHFEPILEKAVRRMPILATAGIHTFFNGPESFTPDDRYYLGEAPELRGYWVAAGYNSVGIAGSGGAGFALAQWIEDGEPPFDLWDVDIRRAQPFQRNRRYLRERVSETLGLLYADHFPYRQPATARGVRRSPLHEHLKSRGAVFGETAGWERANWFAEARPGARVPPELAAAELVPEPARRAHGRPHRRRPLRHDLLRQDPHRGPRRARLPAAPLRQPARRRARAASSTPRCSTPSGGIESDLTVTRLSETAFLAVVPGATLQRDLAWLRRHLDPAAFVTITDMTAAEAVLVLMGPRSREIIARASPDDFSNAAFPFGTAREIEIGMGLARAHRVTYVGELGWELYVSSDQAAHVFEALEEAGAPSGLRLCGLHTLDSCRIEKAYRHFGHDITDEDHVLEAGLGFAVKPAKGDFIGRDAVLSETRRKASPAASSSSASATPRPSSSTTRPSSATAASSAPSPPATTATSSAPPSASATSPARARPKPPSSPPPGRSRSPAAASPPTPPSPPSTTRRASAPASSGPTSSAPSLFFFGKKPGEQCRGCGGGERPAGAGEHARAHLRTLARTCAHNLPPKGGRTPNPRLKSGKPLSSHFPAAFQPGFPQPFQPPAPEFAAAPPIPPLEPPRPTR